MGLHDTPEENTKLEAYRQTVTELSLQLNSAKDEVRILTEKNIALEVENRRLAEDALVAKLVRQLAGLLK